MIQTQSHPWRMRNLYTGGMTGCIIEWRLKCEVPDNDGGRKTREDPSDGLLAKRLQKDWELYGSAQWDFKEKQKYHLAERALVTYPVCLCVFHLVLDLLRT